MSVKAKIKINVGIVIYNRNFLETQKNNHKYIDIFYKNINKYHPVRVYMKKIVSTMFKCGAICASLTTAFADEPAPAAEISLSSQLTDYDKLEKSLKILSEVTESLIKYLQEPSDESYETISLLPIRIKTDGKGYHFEKLQESSSFGDIWDTMQIKKNDLPNQALASLAFYILNPSERIYFDESRIIVTPDGIFEVPLFPNGRIQ